MTFTSPPVIATQIPVLDRGYVRLVDSMGSDLSIVRSARVSHNADWRSGLNEGNDEKLIRYLWNHKHGTPFESVAFTFEIKAPIFIFRQWHRHRTQSYNEISARYTELPAEFYIPEPQVIGKQDAKNKQARVAHDLPQLNASEQIRAYTRACESVYHTYEWLLAEGWPRELARMVLPVSMYSRMFATMNLRNLFGFLTLRADEHAQWEIQQYAEAIIKIIEPIVPVALGVWRENPS